jgi:hypothetical protein
MMWRCLRRLALVVALAVGAGASPPVSLWAGQQTTHVKGYTGKDGTVVKAHERKVSGRKKTAATADPMDGTDPMGGADPMAVRFGSGLL